jgi:ribose transport system substrate-binding protein
MKKLFYLLSLLVIASMVLTACAVPPAPQAPAAAPAAEKAAPAAEKAAPAPAGKTVKLGFSTMDKSNPYHAAVAAGVEERCKALGWDCTINDAKLDAATQVSAIENFIASKAQYILVSPVDPASLEPLVKKAHDAGITWISIAQDVKGYDVFLSVPELAYGLEIGHNAGKWMQTHYKGPVEVGIIDYPELPQIIDRAKGIQDGIKELYPEAVFVARASAPDPEKGMKAAETIMQAHPNIKVIACINDGGCLGAAEAVKAMGKATPDFAVFGADATDEALAKIKEGGIYRGTVDIGPKGMGILAVDTVGKLAAGEKLSSNQIPVKMMPIVQEEKK